VPQAGRIIGAVAIYVSGFAVWLYWWGRVENERRNTLDRPPSANATNSPGSEDEAKFRQQQRLGRHAAGLLLGVAVLVVALFGTIFHRAALWHQLFPPASDADAYTWWALIWGAPLVFLILFCCSTVHAGIAFYTAADRLPRERWSRIMGRCAIGILGVSAVMALVAIGPWAVNQLVSSFELPRAKWALPLLSILTSAIGARAAYFDGQRNSGRNWFTRLLTSAVIAIAPVALVIGVLLLAIMLVQTVVGFSSDAPSLSQHLARLSGPLPKQGWLALAVIWFIGYVSSVLFDENEGSMNGFYRNRLVRCYLAPSNTKRFSDPETDQDPVGDDVLLSRLVKWDGEARPLYPLVCAAANLTETAELDWQDRRAASFVFSPLHCGYVPTSRRLWARPLGDSLSIQSKDSLAHCISLGTAIATSGAAVSPNMGYHSSPPIAFLLTLFNARLGWWVRNRNALPSVWSNLGSKLLGSKLLSELASRTRDTAAYTYVSDGGHFENLGIYELVRRKCRFIVCVDASADPDRDFDSLGNAIHKCRVDFGASIDIDVSLMRPDANGVSKRGAVLGKIRYGDCTGLLLYIKPSITGGETADIARYSSANAEFPHEPTHDQFFDEHQFEAYRQLGESMGSSLFNLGGERWELVRAGRKNDLPTELDLFSNEAKEGLLIRLEHWLFEPSDATALRFTTHGAALCRLLERQRLDEDLASLDGQLNAGWSKAGGKQGQLTLPSEDQFRPCFYFVQEVIQLMEAVYLDLDLERNFNHPDNRGWMNLFRQWTWVPMFRVVWALTSQSLGSRFVHFCEEALGAPRVSGALRMRWSRNVQDPTALAKGLHDARKISAIENEILTSRYVTSACAKSARMDVGRLIIKWDLIFDCPDKIQRLRLKNLDLGLVVAVSARSGADVMNGTVPLRKIIVGRVQDHVRRMGFGAEMIYLALKGERSSIDDASVAKVRYGKTIGKLDAATAQRQRKELQEMLRRARRRRGLLPKRSVDIVTSQAT
jgi:hypothetical protein